MNWKRLKNSMFPSLVIVALCVELFPYVVHFVGFSDVIEAVKAEEMDLIPLWMLFEVLFFPFFTTVFYQLMRKS